MKSDIAKAVLGVVTAVTAVTLINKVIKQGNIGDVLQGLAKDVNLTIDLDALTPKEEKLLNPNGEDFTVKPEYVRIDEKDLSNHLTSDSENPYY